MVTKNYSSYSWYNLLSVHKLTYRTWNIQQLRPYILHGIPRKIKMKRQWKVLELRRSKIKWNMAKKIKIDKYNHKSLSTKKIISSSNKNHRFLQFNYSNTNQTVLKITKGNSNNTKRKPKKKKTQLYQSKTNNKSPKKINK